MVLQLEAAHQIHSVIQKTGSQTLCSIALSFHNVLYQKYTKCLRKLGVVNSDLIRVPPAASLHTLLCNVDVNKIMLMCTVHVTQLKC